MHSDINSVILEGYVKHIEKNDITVKRKYTVPVTYMVAVTRKLEKSYLGEGLCDYVEYEIPCIIEGTLASVAFSNISVSDEIRLVGRLAVRRYKKDDRFVKGFVMFVEHFEVKK